MLLKYGESAPHPLGSPQDMEALHRSARVRQQPVHDDDIFALYTVWLDADEKLCRWMLCHAPTIALAGNDGPRFLIETLKLWIGTIETWEPVRVEDLRVGMTFQKRAAPVPT
jgi:hypothetical protein